MNELCTEMASQPALYHTRISPKTRQGTLRHSAHVARQHCLPWGLQTEHAG